MKNQKELEDLLESARISKSRYSIELVAGTWSYKTLVLFLAMSGNTLVKIDFNERYWKYIKKEDVVAELAQYVLMIPTAATEEPLVEEETFEEIK